MHRFTSSSTSKSNTALTLTAVDVDGVACIHTVKTDTQTRRQSYKSQAKRDQQLTEQVTALEKMGWALKENGPGTARLTSHMDDTRTLTLTAVDVDGVACIHNDETLHQTAVRGYNTATERDSALSGHAELLEKTGWTAQS